MKRQTLNSLKVSIYYSLIILWTNPTEHWYISEISLMVFPWIRYIFIISLSCSENLSFLPAPRSLWAFIAFHELFLFNNLFSSFNFWISFFNSWISFSCFFIVSPLWVALKVTSPTLFKSLKCSAIFNRSFNSSISLFWFVALIVTSLYCFYNSSI